MRTITIIIALLTMTITHAFSQTKTGSFSHKKNIKTVYNYVLHVPQNINEKKPLIIFLHGSGERGDDSALLSIHGPLKYLKYNFLDSYILAPQLELNQEWDSESLHKLILKIISENQIDTDRVYLTGLSLGGWGCWNLAFAHPETFAALVPIAGFVDRMPMLNACSIKSIPTRIYHGLLDDVVSVEYAKMIYNKLIFCGMDVQLIIFSDANHDSWSRVYDDPEFYVWLFKQKQ